MYRLVLLEKMKIYLVQYIPMLKLVYRDLKLLVYKVNTYKGQEENKQPVKKIINYKEINNKIWFKVLQEDYNKTIQELEENFKNAKDKIKMYQRKLSQAVKRKTGQRMNQLKATDKYLKTLPLGYGELFPSLVDQNPFFYWLPVYISLI